jgi:hypothetical protein
MTPQERIANKEAGHARRQVEADRNDRQPDQLRPPPAPKTPPPPDVEWTR